MPNLVLIGAAVWRVLMKQKCDGRTKSRTEGRRAFHSPPFFNAGDNKRMFTLMSVKYRQQSLQTNISTGACIVVMSIYE